MEHSPECKAKAVNNDDFRLADDSTIKSVIWRSKINSRLLGADCELDWNWLIEWLPGQTYEVIVKNFHEIWILKKQT